MARIAGVNIPTGKRVPVALTYITGIGPSKAREIIEATGIDASRRMITDKVLIKGGLTVTPLTLIV